MLELVFSALLTWVFAAVMLLIVDRLNIGLKVGGFSGAMVAALVIAIVNLILGTLLQVLSLPLNVLTCGLLSWLITWIIAAIVLWVSDKLLRSFEIVNFVSAMVAALVLAVLSWAASAIASGLFG